METTLLAVASGLLVLRAARSTPWLGWLALVPIAIALRVGTLPHASRARRGG